MSPLSSRSQQLLALGTTITAALLYYFAPSPIKNRISSIVASSMQYIAEYFTPYPHHKPLKGLSPEQLLDAELKAAEPGSTYNPNDYRFGEGAFYFIGSQSAKFKNAKYLTFPRPRIGNTIQSFLEHLRQQCNIQKESYPSFKFLLKQKEIVEEIVLNSHSNFDIELLDKLFNRSNVLVSILVIKFPH